MRWSHGLLHRAKRQLGHVVLIRSSIHGSPFTDTFPDTFPDTLKLKRYLALSHPTKKRTLSLKGETWVSDETQTSESDFGVG